MTWTREHDKVLAELEGLKNFVYGEVFNENLYHRDQDEPAGNLFEVPRYNLNIADAIRAAEAWVAQAPDARFYDIGRYLNGTDGKKFLVVLSQAHSHGCYNWVGKSDNLAEAIAFALYEAVK